MAVSLISCYFLPFLLFFAAQLALPKSPAPFAFGIAGLSIGTLILYFILKDQKKVIHVPVPSKELPAVQQSAIETKAPAKQHKQSSIATFAQKSLKQPAQYKPQTKAALVLEQKLALEKQKDYFLHESQRNAQAIKELEESLEASRQALVAKATQLEALDNAFQAQAAEMANLKFEMYTLLRIDSYMSEKETPKNLAAASL